MFNELFLIAHKVRGEPAFDVAVQMHMPDGVWWIVATSGHRAYPYWYTELFHTDHKCVIMLEADPNGMCEVPPMPEGLRDHYAVSATPAPVQPKKSLNLADLGL